RFEEANNGDAAFVMDLVAHAYVEWRRIAAKVQDRRQNGNETQETESG
ncbi:MAG: hypothetical protein IT259_03555, partial [Saprospiraceae bacterium]|nr:hypothetical protein [Saprospiraceae bacterium]